MSTSFRRLTNSVKLFKSNCQAKEKSISCIIIFFYSGLNWTGKFGENSNQWPAVIKRMINLTEKSKESIFLCFESEFMEIFDWIDIFRIQEEYHYQAMQTNVIKNCYSIRTFQLSYPASCFLGCVQ